MSNVMPQPTMYLAFSMPALATPWPLAYSSEKLLQKRLYPADAGLRQPPDLFIKSDNIERGQAAIGDVDTSRWESGLNDFLFPLGEVLDAREHVGVTSR